MNLIMKIMKSAISSRLISYLFLIVSSIVYRCLYSQNDIHSSQCRSTNCISYTFIIICVYARVCNHVDKNLSANRLRINSNTAFYVSK